MFKKHKSSSAKATEDREKSKNQDEFKEAKEQLLRVAADFDNFRKRTEEDKPRIREASQVELLRDLLPVFDNFERAYKHIPEEDKEKDWVKGIVAIERLFHKILADMGIKKYHVEDKEFNPETMDAIMYLEDKEVPEDFVIEELEPGYKKGEKIIRHAKVKVSKGKAS